MKTRIAVIVLVTLGVSMPIIAGCVGISQETSGSFVAPLIGVIANENLQIVEIIPGSAAEKAGLQVGDILLDLTWIPSDAPAYLPKESDVVNSDTTIATIEGEGATDSIDSTSNSPALPDSVTPIPPPVESYIDKDTVPFNESDRIGALTVYGVPLTLRLMRGEQVLELTIVPTVLPPLPSLTPGEIRPTLTPLPPTYYYY